jgi:hypothetical protein
MKRAALFVAARQPVLDCSLFKSRILGSPSLEMGKFGRSACRALSPIADWQESTPNSKWGRVSMSDPISAIRNSMHLTQNMPFIAKAPARYQGAVIWGTDAGFPGGS